MAKTFGPNTQIMKEIFKSDRQYLLAVRTPCSRDFSGQAEDAGKMLDVPVYWMNAALDHLESVLQEVVSKKLRIMENKGKG